MGRDHGQARSTARRGPRRQPAQRFLIYCEGRTEKEYFDHVQRVLHEPGVVVRPYDPKRSDAVAVVDEAALADVEADDQIWAVFDHDGKTERVRLARDRATAAKVQVALSNPSFEVWLLWHRVEFSRSCDQKEIERHLEAQCSGYVKGAQFDPVPYAGRLDVADRAIASSARAAPA